MELCDLALGSGSAHQVMLRLDVRDDSDDFLLDGCRDLTVQTASIRPFIRSIKFIHAELGS